MIYVSLPVHTQPGVVASQGRNFSVYFPQAVVVLHASAEARFTMAQLQAALRDTGSNNVIVNPHRASTAWGNILQAHLTNVAFIRSLGDARRICLHASNDMLVRPGLIHYLDSGHNFCNRRIVHPGTRWRFGAAALADAALMNLRRRLGGIDAIGSQIEGSAYEAELLYAIADLIGGMAAELPAVAYPREEVWISTLAHGLQAQVDGKPYVFSELHRFDRVFWKIMACLDPVIGRTGPTAVFLRRAIEYGMIKTGFHRINRRWVDRVAAADIRRLAPYQTLDDGNNIWRVFDRNGLFGVKRVPRRVNDPVRRHIESRMQAHPPAVRDFDPPLRLAVPARQ